MFGHDQVAHCSSGLKPLRRRAPDVIQAVLFKFETEILFGNAPLVNHEITVTVLATNHRPAH